MKTDPKITALTILAFALALVLQAQAPKSQDESATPRESTPSMQGMMDQCAKQCDGAMQQCDDDAAKMRSAIDDVLKMCEQMKGMMSQCTEENRKACMQMMDMMGQIHGGMMMPTGRNSIEPKK